MKKGLDLGMAKVAHVATVDLSLSHLLLNQMLSLKAAGCDVTGISAAGPDVPVIHKAGIRHLAAPMTRSLTPVADAVSLLKLRRLMRRERFTIVHTHTPKAGLLGQLAARLAGVPIVINTLHGFYFHEYMPERTRRFYIALEKIAARCSDLILSQNREDVQTAISEGICSPEKIRHLGNGIDLSEFSPDEVPDGAELNARTRIGIPFKTPVVGFVGRLAARRKGFLDFLAAAKEISAVMPEVRFLIVGDSDRGKPDAVEPSVAADYCIADRCYFTGKCPNSELPTLYKLMNVLVLPSLFEGVPRVVMEASAMGIPAVVTDVKGNREAVEHGRNGLRVPLADVRALKEAILEILTRPQTALAMSREARCIATERFDEQAVFEKIKNEYSRLLEQKGRLTQ